MEVSKLISKKQIERLPIYLKYLQENYNNGVEFTSAPQISKYLGYSEEQVRKDLQVVSKESGKPKTGRKVVDIINDIETFLGYNDVTSAIIVGCGNLGGAFMKYGGFKTFGLKILAGFDIDANKIGKTIDGKTIFPLDKLVNLVPRLNVHIAILTTPVESSQSVVELLKQAGIKGIWNFVPIHLDVGDDIVVENVNLASSLAVLSHKLKRNLK